MPDVWLLVVNWNGATLLPGCLDALRRAAPSARIVVVDNGSADGSAEVVKGVPGVEWLPLGENRGFAEANDVGMRLALAGGANWIGLVNPDVRVEPGWLDALVAAGDAHPRAGLLQGLMLFEDRPDVVNSTGLVVDAMGRARDRDFDRPLAALRREDGVVTGTTGGAVLLRAEMLREVGLFDPAYFAYYEDLDLSLRAARAGWECRYVAAARALHGYERSFGPGSPKKKYLLARNHLRVVAAHAPFLVAIALVPVLAAARVAGMVPLELVRGRVRLAWAHLRGATDGVAAAAAVLARRARRRPIPPGAEPVDVPLPPPRPRRRAAASAFAAIALAAAALAIASLPWAPRERTGAPSLALAAAGDGPLRAGAAAIALAPAPGAPLAGFPHLDWRSRGERDPVMARALVLEEPGLRVALASVETLLVTRELSRAVEARVADLAIDRVVLAATHTHAGPGGYWDQPLAERVALGPYDPARFEHLADRIADAIRAAAGAVEPATISWGRADARRLVENRDGGPVDGRLVSLRVARAGGGDLARVVVFAAHPTLLGSSNRLVSGDWPGALARAERSPVLVFQGALGDQSASTEIARDPEAYASRVARALRGVHEAPPDARPRLAVAVARAVLPPPDLGLSPGVLRRAARNALYRAFPASAEVTALRLGPLTLLAVPAEPVAALGERWRRGAGGEAEILALANDYVGYVETEGEMARGRGETSRTYYGPELASRLEAAARLALAAAERAAPRATAAR